MSHFDIQDAPLIAFEARRIRVLFEGHRIAESQDALVLREPGRKPVWYFPRRDVGMAYLGQGRTVTVSPSKGAATYFTITRDWHVVEDAIWSFETPPDTVQAIAGRIAFLPRHFDFQAEGHRPCDWDIEVGGPD